MLIKTMTLAGGLVGAAGLSQFPEYSQQYTQRLGGAVDELGRFVAEFDADAAKLDITRTQALVQLAQGGEMGAARAETMANTMARHTRLTGDLAALRDAGPFTRIYNAGRFRDGEIAAAALNDFKPALPFTFEGLVFSGAGFVVGLGVCMAFFATIAAVLRLPFGRRKTA